MSWEIGTCNACGEKVVNDVDHHCKVKLLRKLLSSAVSARREATRRLDGYSAMCAELEARLAAAERWREEVADGLGYLNRPGGQGGYEVADPQTIVAAFRSTQLERDGAESTLAALRAAGTAVVEAYADCRARGSFAGFWTHVDDLSKALALEPCPICDDPRSPATEPPRPWEIRCTKCGKRAWGRGLPEDDGDVCSCAVFGKFEPAGTPRPNPTHRCKVCGALWREWGPIGARLWSLVSGKAGPCCDNAPMGAQVEPIAEFHRLCDPGPMGEPATVGCAHPDCHTSISGRMLGASPEVCLDVGRAYIASEPARPTPKPTGTPAPIHWLGDCTDGGDLWELTRRRDRFPILGTPTTLYFKMDDGTSIVVPSGWWIYDWHTDHPRVSSAPPAPEAQ